MGQITSRPLSDDMMMQLLREVRTWRHNVHPGVGKQIRDVQIRFSVGPLLGAGVLYVEVCPVPGTHSQHHVERREFDFHSVNGLRELLKNRMSLYLIDLEAMHEEAERGR